MTICLYNVLELRKCFLFLRKVREKEYLLVGPLVHGVLVRGDALGEPEADLMLGGLDGVGAVDDVAANLDAEVSTDGAGLGGAEGSKVEAWGGGVGWSRERERKRERT